MRKAFADYAAVTATHLNGKLTHISAPLAKKPHIQFDAFNINVPGVSKPAVLSFSTADPHERKMRYALIYEAGSR